ncbi:MAG: formylmethanofuran--tetrahydromethanopterin N-formyltransferase [Candidatus Nitrospinota bacterium M3_3B_026]
MKINGVFIENARAEAFRMPFARVLVTAENDYWLAAATSASTGFATSIIGCGAEAGLEGRAKKTPDGRPGVYLLFFSRTEGKLKEQLIARAGQAILTCPTTVLFDGGGGRKSGEKLDVGARLRYFGDGHERPRKVHGRKMWSIPVTEGEFFVEESLSIRQGVAGGAFLIMARDRKSAADAAIRAVGAIDHMPGVILPFPGGVCRSASKVGSKYKFLGASTNEKFCPSLRDEAGNVPPKGVGSVLEIIINGVDLRSVKAAMGEGVRAACGAEGVVSISAPEFGGALGDVFIGLRDVLA